MAAYLERLANVDALDLPLVEAAEQLRRLGDEGPRRYLLVERSRYNGEVWASSHDTPADAASAYASQECPEDFTPSLVDLDTGAHYYGAIHAKWEPHPDSDPPAEPDPNRTAELAAIGRQLGTLRGWHHGRRDSDDEAEAVHELDRALDAIDNAIDLLDGANEDGPPDLAAVCEGANDDGTDVYVVDCQACGIIVETYPEDDDGVARPFAEETARTHNRTVHGADR